jgi:aminoglycoside phosphotransferase (APT) family kinase protein
MTATPPPAEGVRLQWAEVPEAARRAFEDWAGSRVVAAVSQPSGFSPGVAARVRLSDGRGLFVKAIGPKPNPESPAFHRMEARIASVLPPEVPAPRLRWTYDDDNWVMLAFDEIEGRHPAQPWHDDELQQVIDSMARLAVVLTPSPLPAGEVPTLGEQLTMRIHGWQMLRDAPPDQLDEWSRRHLHELADLEALAPSAASGDTLLHFDIRADNILIGSDGRVWFFDWPHACVGADWFDAVAFAPSVTMQGGPPPEEVFARYARLRDADPADVTASIATAAGFFTRTALEPPPPGLPTVRAFQAAQGIVAREWLAQRTGWT